MSAATISHEVDLHPVNVTATIFRTQSGLTLQMEGEFHVPTVDPTKFSITSIGSFLSGNAGGAAWRTGREDEQMRASITTNFAIGLGAPLLLTSGSGGTGGQFTSVFSTAYYQGLDDFLIPANRMPSAADLRDGSARDQGGFVPVEFRISASASGQHAFVGPPYYPSVFVFITGLELGITYTLEETALSQPDQLPVSDALSSLQYTQTTFNNNETEVPNVVMSEFPASVVPEPSATTLVLLTSGLLLAHRRWRQQHPRA